MKQKVSTCDDVFPVIDRGNCASKTQNLYTKLPLKRFFLESFTRNQVIKIIDRTDITHDVQKTIQGRESML